MGINLKFPLRSYRKGFFEMNNTTIAAVREDIKILLLTQRGERLINSGIGTNISIMAGQLFQPHDREVLEQEIGAEIRAALAAYMPYVTLRSINVYSDEDHPAGYNVQRNQALVLMHYGLNTINGMSDSLALTLNNPG
jgi:phage baseplate assembly protein W